MPYVLDIIVIAVVVLFVITGVKKGIIDTAFGILSFFLAALLAFMFYVPFTNYVESTSLGKGAEQSIHTYVYNGVIDSILKDSDDKEDSQRYIDDENVTSEEVIDYLKLPEFLRENIYQKTDFELRNTAQNAVSAVSSALAKMVFRLLCSISLFLILIIILFLIKKLLLLIFKIPVFGTVNKIAGGAAGFVKGVLIAYLILAVIAPVSVLVNANWISDMLDNSFFYQLTNGDNIILKMFMQQ